MTLLNSNIYEFHYHILDLDIPISMITGMMGYSDKGYHDKIPDNIPGLIEEYLGKTTEISAIKGGYIICNDVKIIEDKTIIVDDVEFHTDEIITSQIRNSEMIALFICTAGAGIDTMSRSLYAKGNILDSYIVDTIGSAIVESAMDKIHEQLATQMEFFEYRLTNRFSPGYCGWEVEEQRKVFDFFPSGFCGIRLTDSSFMYPSKSISGIIGIGENVQSKSYHCADCMRRECNYRK